MLARLASEASSGSSLLRSPFFWAAAGAAVAIPAYRWVMGPAAPSLPVLGHVPSVTLVDQEDQPFRTEALQGKPWIANFFFTSCTTVCPPMMAELAKIQKRLADADLPVRIASITVDPETDEPQVLKEYGARLGADFDRWHFLTGDPETIARLARTGFKTHVGVGGSEASAAMPAEHRAHAARWMLVDAEGAVRGAFEVSPQGTDALLRRVARLAKGR